MAKSRRNARSVMKTIKKTTSRALPVVDNGLKTVGMATKGAIKTSIPIVEKGVSAVYGTMATGFDLGIKGVKKVAKGVKARTMRSRSLAGGKSRRRKARK
jgi:hypothetical protein